MPWMLSKKTGSAAAIEKTLADWGIRQGQLTFQSQKPDTFEWVMTALKFEDDPVFANADRMVLTDPDGIVRFRGSLLTNPRYASPSEENHRFKAVGPWYDLENLVFQVLWFGPSVYTSHGLLDLGPTTLVTNRVQIETVLDWAISKGANLQKGQILPATDEAVQPWMSEVRDLACSEVIRDQLRWVPNAVAYFDYTTDPPTLNIRDASHLTATSIPITDCSSVEVSPRYDLVRPSVSIHFEIAATVNGERRLEVINDTAPGGDGTAIGGFVSTVDLRGPTVSFATQSIVCDVIDPYSVAWWKTLVPFLNDPLMTNIVIKPGSFYRDGTLLLPNHVVDGSPANWMPFDFEHEAIRMIFSAKYNGQDKPDQVATAQITSTDGITGTYESRSIISLGDPQPVGLAQFLYNQMKDLHYEGSLSLEESEIRLAPTGNVLNISGGRTEWASMAGIIQEIRQTIDTGRTEITFGPPNHLSISDLIGVLR